MGVALCVMASTLTLVSGLQRGFAGEGERADMQQRIRVASDALYRDLVMAGAGAYQGAHSGPLDFFVASVMPFRQGAHRRRSPRHVQVEHHHGRVPFTGRGAANHHPAAVAGAVRFGALERRRRMSAGRSGLWVRGRYGRDGLRRDGVVRHVQDHERRGRDAAAAAHDGRYAAVRMQPARRSSRRRVTPTTRRRTTPPTPIS